MRKVQDQMPPEKSTTKTVSSHQKKDHQDHWGHKDVKVPEDHTENVESLDFQEKLVSWVKKEKLGQLDLLVSQDVTELT